MKKTREERVVKEFEDITKQLQDEYTARLKKIGVKNIIKKKIVVRR